MQDRQTELREAIAAADDALYHLRGAQECLKSAGGWGMFDLLGGGMLSTFMKHGKMNQAKQELEDARTALRRFAKELQDVDQVLDIDMRTDDFLSFADYFFDGMIADWMMQQRISDAKAQVADAITRVTHIRSQLNAML